jgi:hypothetical protein
MSTDSSHGVPAPTSEGGSSTLRDVTDATGGRSRVIRSEHHVRAVPGQGSEGRPTVARRGQRKLSRQPSDRVRLRAASLNDQRHSAVRLTGESCCRALRSRARLVRSARLSTSAALVLRSVRGEGDQRRWHDGGSGRHGAVVGRSRARTFSGLDRRSRGRHRRRPRTTASMFGSSRRSSAAGSIVAGRSPAFSAGSLL